MTQKNSRRLVSDYVNYRLNKNGLSWPNCPELPTPGKVERTMRCLGDEFEQRYTEVFSEMCKQLHITASTAQQTFNAIVKELFSDGIKWGRVVALFAFGGCLAVRCSVSETSTENGVGAPGPPLVEHIVDWVSEYIDTHLQTWILKNGGWDGFVTFYEGKPDMKNESPWPSLKTICGYTVGAIGVLTLGAILAQRS